MSSTTCSSERRASSGAESGGAGGADGRFAGGASAGVEDRLRFTGTAAGVSRSALPRRRIACSR